MKKFDFFSFHSIKMEQEALYFGTNGIIKNAFIKMKIQLILMKQILKEQYYLIRNHWIQT